MLSKAVFLDRDGTINEDRMYVHEAKDFIWLNGVFEALRIFQKLGYSLFIVTNQSGIGRGYYDEEQLIKFNDWIMKELSINGVNVEKIYYCPHHENAKIRRYRHVCRCRKPKTGLFYLAAREYNLDLDHSIVIGDKLRDLQLCFETDCTGYLIGNNESTDIISDVFVGKYPNIMCCDSLLAVANILIKKQNEIAIGADDPNSFDDDTLKRLYGLR